MLSEALNPLTCLCAIVSQSNASPAEVQLLADELLPALPPLLALDDRGRAALAAEGALPWEPLSRFVRFSAHSAHSVSSGYTNAA